MTREEAEAARKPRTAGTGRLRLPDGTGKAGEAAAEAYLRSRGYSVVARNFRSSRGEIDLVAQERETFVFFEVKAARRASEFGPPELRLTRAKQSRIVTGALSYLAQHNLSKAEWRIDVLAIELDLAGRVVGLRHIKNAVEEQ